MLERLVVWRRLIRKSVKVFNRSASKATLATPATYRIPSVAVSNWLASKALA